MQLNHICHFQNKPFVEFVISYFQCKKFSRGSKGNFSELSLESRVVQPLRSPAGLVLSWLLDAFSTVNMEHPAKPDAPNRLSILQAPWAGGEHSKSTRKPEIQLL